jgi:glycosyltransferase involved in cell wall biosynthesis
MSENSKRILYVTPYYKPSWFYGGPPKSISEQAEYLVKTFNCQIDVLTLNRNGDNRLFDSNETVVKNVDGVVVHYLPSSQTKLGRTYFSSPEVETYLENFKSHDLVHIHMLFNGISTAGARFAIKHRIPFGYSVHGMLDTFSLTRSKWVKRAHRFLYENRQLLMASFVHFTTEAERNNAVISKAANSTVIPLGMVFEPLVEHPRSQSHFDLRMIYIGRINRKKGLDLLLRAISQLPTSMKDRVALDVFGEDDDHFFPRLETLVRENRLQKVVAFKGKLDPGQRNQTLQSYDLLALTSHQENFGLVVAEALDQKIPVLISDKVNLCDDVERQQCGWVTSLSVKNITERIEEAFRTPKHIRRHMGQEGHRYVRGSFSFEEVGRKYWDLYRSVFPTRGQ